MSRIPSRKTLPGAPRARPGLLLLAALLLSCSAPAAPATEQAVEVVERFFAALPQGSCESLEPLLAPAGSGRPCPEVLAEYRAHRVRLLAIESAMPDGRDEDAILVRARLEQDGKPQRQPAVLRVVRHEGRWRFRP